MDAKVEETPTQNAYIDFGATFGAGSAYGGDYMNPTLNETVHWHTRNCANGGGRTDWISFEMPTNDVQYEFTKAHFQKRGDKDSEQRLTSFRYRYKDSPTSAWSSYSPSISLPFDNGTPVSTIITKDFDPPFKAS